MGIITDDVVLTGSRTKAIEQGDTISASFHFKPSLAAAYYQISIIADIVGTNGTYAATVMRGAMKKKSMSAGTTYAVSSELSPVVTQEWLLSYIESIGGDPHNRNTININIDLFNSSGAEIQDGAFEQLYSEKYYAKIYPPVVTVGTVNDMSTSSPKHTEKYGAHIANVTPARATFSYTVQDGVTGIRLRIRLDGVDYDANPTYGDIPPRATGGTYTPAVVVRDARGNETVAEFPSYTVLDYAAPSVSAYTAQRCAKNVEQQWVDDDDGTNIWHTLTASVQNYTAGNPYTVKVWAQPRGGALTEYTLMTGTGVTDGAISLTDSFGADDLFKTVTIEKNKSYYVAVEVIDWFGNTTGRIESSRSVTAAGALFDIETNGVAVGMVVGGELPDDAADKTFECAYPAKLYGGLTNVQTGIVEFGSISANGSKNIAVTFEHEYAEAPVVLMNPFASSSSNAAVAKMPVHAGKDSVTATGFTARCVNGDSSAHSMKGIWLAFGVPKQ